MKLGKYTNIGLVLAGLVLILPTVAATQMMDTNCLPSCEVDDGRFLAITDTRADQGLATFADQGVDIQIRSPLIAGFTLRIFDGETSDASGFWDINTQAAAKPDPRVVFRLFPDVDPFDGNPDDVAPVLVFNGFAEELDDNAWTSFSVTNDPAACLGNPGQDPCESEYAYVLRATLESVPSALGETVRSVFKVQTFETDVSIQVTQQPFGFNAAMPSPKELLIIYPGCQTEPFPACVTDGPTTYDGTFSFFLNVQAPAGSGPIHQIEIWDGDLDRGDADGGNNDTDDFNTPSIVGDLGELPPWAFRCTEPGLEPGEVGCTDPCAQGVGDPTPAPGDECIVRRAEWEGVAGGLGPSTGNPPDNRPPGSFVFLREPSIYYEVILRERYDGQIGGLDEVLASNGAPGDDADVNPSGNREWEVFCISQGSALCDVTLYDPANPGVPTTRTVASDAQVTELPPGLYEVRVSGLDLENLNLFRFDSEVVPDPGYTVGDFVWLDRNGDGIEQPGEPGIPGVEVKLWNADQTVLLDTTTTDDSGMYLFEGLEPGEYLVEVTPANSEPGGALEGMAITLPPQALIVTNDGGDGLGGAEREVPGFAVEPVGSGSVRTFDFPYICPCDVQCGACEGKVTSLTLQYTGLLINAQVTVVQKKDGAVVFDDVVQMGDEFSFDGTWKKGTLGTEIKIYVNGQLDTEIHTSCSQPIGPGLQSGSFLVVSGASREGGPLCPLEDDNGDSDSGSDSDSDSGSDSDSDSGSDSDSDSSSDSDSDSSSDSDSDSSSDSDSDSSSDSDSDSGSGSPGGGVITGVAPICLIDFDEDSDSDSGSDSDSDSGGGGDCGCEGKVQDLTLRYNGSTVDAQVLVKQKKDGKVVFNDFVQPGTTFSFSGMDKKGTLGTEISIYVNGQLNTRIHTSCSQPIGPGLVSGDFEVVEGTSREGGDLCPLGADDGDSDSDSDSDGDSDSDSDSDSDGDSDGGGLACHINGEIVTDDGDSDSDSASDSDSDSGSDSDSDSH